MVNGRLRSHAAAPWSAAWLLTRSFEPCRACRFMDMGFVLEQGANLKCARGGANRKHCFYYFYC